MNLLSTSSEIYAKNEHFMQKGSRRDEKIHGSSVFDTLGKSRLYSYESVVNIGQVLLFMQLCMQRGR